MSQSEVLLEFQALPGEGDATLALLSLNRPQQANAFNGAMLAALDSCLSQVEDHPACRLLILFGRGRHFSAGADLAWMREASKLSYAENLAEAERLARMFRRLSELSMPTLAVVRGAAYGGAVGLTAACDMAIAADDTTFSLSEVRLGLMPAVIYPHLARKLRPGQLKRLSLTGAVFSGREALDYGLVELACPPAELATQLNLLTRQLVTAGTDAQRALKRLATELESADGTRDDALSTRAIASARVGAEGQAGLTAFLNKTTPGWSLELAEPWRVEVEL